MGSCVIALGNGAGSKHERSLSCSAVRELAPLPLVVTVLDW